MFWLEVGDIQATLAYSLIHLPGLCTATTILATSDMAHTPYKSLVSHQCLEGVHGTSKRDK